MQNKNFVTCECGGVFSTNTARAHVNSKKCKASIKYKGIVFKYTELSRNTNLAWDVRLGMEAKSFSWVGPVLCGEIDFKYLTFIPPRPPNVGTPSSYRRHSISRMGENNPMSHKNHYGETFLTGRIVEIYHEYMMGTTTWTSGVTDHIKNRLDTNYPEWSIGLMIRDEKGRNKSKNAKIAMILRKNTSDFDINFRIVRGRMISKGQKASPELIRKARESAIKNGSRRTTKTQIRLFDIVKEMDEGSILEYRIQDKLYDIYSPKFNALIEMHGSIWHNPNKAPSSILPKVLKNVQNDKFKLYLAIKLGYKLWVFWDDNEQDWNNKLKQYMDSHE